LRGSPRRPACAALRIARPRTAPAAFHGRREAAEALSAELRVAARAHGLIP